jgi:glycosyltransferase involved in cell wall biosynthesis
MLRVLTLSSLFPDASRPNFGIFVEQQTRGLASLPDIELRVVAPLGVPPWPLSALGRYRPLAELPHEEQWRGLHVYRPRFVNLPGTGGRFHAQLLARAVAPLLARIRRDFPFDLIDAEFFFPDGPAGVQLGRRFGVPVSIKARGSDIHRWAHRPSTAPQVIAAGKAAQGLLAVSAAMRRDMIALGLPEHVAVSLTGVDQTRFAPRDRAAAKAKFGITGPLVVSLGALIPIKGHDITIEAVAGLPGVSLLIAGLGPERARLEAQIAGLGLGDRVRLLGPVPHAEIPELLGAADVMALASSSEGLANAWVEALASGTPIVIPDVGGAREVLLDESAGRIVDRTPDAFRAAIAELIAHPLPTEPVVAAARRFTWEANAAHLFAHLQAMVERHRSNG